ncbi:alpha/beta hydrolase [Frateuria sp. Soil773]|uniref:alpha/beta hydrolase n=1 Tax=Frateuria sp. Soil773 TaxID=1736407 RepID=UPI0006FD3FD7|nr:alpha/beta hydrolase [Frateuria sp. Soil773]KRF02140.1 alpha/beta hydrolase [Frateuria sp. Soil773]
MREQAFRFGRAHHLVGIAGMPDRRPANVPEALEPVGVIVLNAGLVHRIGPFRLHVELTRRLNACGYPTLRFDLSTVGDSGASGESRTRTAQVCADAGDAMDLLQRQAGCSRFVLVGLCSGAQNAHTVACTDAKVAGAVFLDGYAYRTAGFHLRHTLPKLVDPRRWWRLLARRRQVAAARGEPVFAVERLPRPVVRADLAGMLDRGLRLCLIYSGGINRYFNHASQFRECFGRLVERPGICTAFDREADHTYVLAGDRQRLLDSIERWLTLNFPIPGTGHSP